MPEHPDSISVMFMLQVPESRLPASQPSDYLLIADAIRSHLHQPVAVELPMWPHTEFQIQAGAELKRQTPVEAFGVSGTVDFGLDSIGHLRKSSLRIATGSTLLDTELTRAVEDADSAGDLEVAGSALRAATTPIELEVKAASGPLPGSITFARWKTMVRNLDTPPSKISGPVPDYPRVARAHGIEGQVRVQFLVDSTGVVAPSAIRIVKGDYAEFNESALKALASTKFSPGRSGGCPVPVLIETSIIFKMAH